MPLRGRGGVPFAVDEWNTAVAKIQNLLTLSVQGKLTDEELKEKLSQMCDKNRALGRHTESGQT